MPYNIRRGRVRAYFRGEQRQQPSWMGFLTQVVSVLNAFVGGAPTHRGGRGRGGGVRGTHRNTRRPQPTASHPPTQDDQDSAPTRGIRDMNSRGGGPGTSEHRGSHQHNEPPRTQANNLDELNTNYGSL